MFTYKGVSYDCLTTLSLCISWCFSCFNSLFLNIRLYEGA